MENEPTMLSFVIKVILPILSLIGVVTLTAFMIRFKIRSERYKTLFLAKYTYSATGSYTAPDGWYTSDIEKAVKRARLELDIAEYGLTEKAKEYIHATSKELNSTGYTAPEMASWLAKEKS